MSEPLINQTVKDSLGRLWTVSAETIVDPLIVSKQLDKIQQSAAVGCSVWIEMNRLQFTLNSIPGSEKP